MNIKPDNVVAEQLTELMQSDAAALLRRSRFLFIGDEDFANCATTLASAMEVAARMIVDGLLERCIVAGQVDGVVENYDPSGPPFTLPAVRKPHPFGYSHAVTGMINGRLIDCATFCASTIDVIEPMLQQADILFVITTGDSSDESYAMQAQAINLARKRWPLVSVYGAAMHVGSRYRSRPDYFDEYDHRTLNACLRFVSADTMQHMAFSPFCADITVPYPHSAPVEALAGVDEIQQSCQAMYSGGYDRTVIVHSPSNKRTKGTAIIKAALDLLPADVLVEYREISGLSFADCIEARKGGHIFIDQINAGVGGFGMSSVEAAGQGMVPIATTHNINPLTYRANGLGVPPVVPVLPSARSLAETLTKLCKNHERLARARWEAYAWAAMGSGSAVYAGTWALAQLVGSIEAQGTQH